MPSDVWFRNYSPYQTHNILESNVSAQASENIAGINTQK